MKLYIYYHCPYCLKARMIFGRKISPSNYMFCSTTTQKHPPGWSVKNRFPILQKDDSRYMPESMDIVH